MSHATFAKKVTLSHPLSQISSVPSHNHSFLHEAATTNNQIHIHVCITMQMFANVVYDVCKRHKWFTHLQTHMSGYIDTRKTTHEKDAAEMIKLCKLAKESEALQPIVQSRKSKWCLQRWCWWSRLNLLKESKSLFDDVSSQDAASDYDKAGNDLLMQLPCMKKCRWDNA